MSHHRYQTQGLVLSLSPRGEANFLYQIITPNLGLIRVLGQGVRLEKSKLRYNLTLYSISELELVRGKEFWRLTGASGYCQSNTAQRQIFSKIGVIILRLMGEGEANKDIYCDLEQAWSLLKREADRSAAELEGLEILLASRLLSRLGYLDPKSLPPLDCSLPLAWSDTIVFIENKKELIRLINQALATSGL